MEVPNLPADFNEGMRIIRDNLPFILSTGTRVLSALVILVVGWMAGNWAQRRIASVKKLDATLSSFLGMLFKYSILSVSMVTVLGQFGVQTASLLAVLGAAGLAIGLAMQGTLSNVAAGMMLLILRPFNVGDYIQAGGIGGTVKSLGLFGTELATPDNVYIFLPNGKIWGADVWNYSRYPHRRQDIAAAISYHDDINKALEIIRGVLDAEPRLLRGEEGREPEALVSNMGDFSIDIIVRFWCSRDDYWALKWALTKNVKEALDAGGITIPFPTRTLEISGGSAASLPKGNGV